MVPEDPTDIKMPSPNALPLLVFHGWDALAAFVNRGAVDPNEHDSRYFYIIDDLVKATNGVYRPVFLTYNTRCGIEDIGNEVARRVHGPGSDLFKGLPVAGRKTPQAGSRSTTPSGSAWEGSYPAPTRHSRKGRTGCSSLARRTTAPTA